MAKYDLSSLRGVVSAAAPLTEDTEREFLRRFNLDAIYQGDYTSQLPELLSAGKRRSRIVTIKGVTN